MEIVSFLNIPLQDRHAKKMCGNVGHVFNVTTQSVKMSRYKRDLRKQMDKDQLRTYPKKKYHAPCAVLGAGIARPPRLESLYRLLFG
jgi:hypothetical protein